MMHRLWWQNLSYYVCVPVLMLWGASSLEARETYVYCSAAQQRQIVTLKLEQDTGHLTEVSRVELPGQPGALTSTADHQFLLAALRSTGQLASLKINRETGALELINIVPAGEDPAQISLTRDGRCVLTAYYVAAKVSVHGLDQQGRLSEQALQEIPTARNAHAIVPDRDDKYVYVPHTGPNAIYQFRWEAALARLKPLEPVRLQRPEQTGPRHLDWHPRQPIAYIDNEQGSSVTAYRVGTEGQLQPLTTVSTLPAGFGGSNSTAEIRVHPSGRFLYVSNRGHDSIAMMRLDSSGESLQFIATTPTEQTPRSIALDSSGRWLFAAGESSGNLAVYQMNTETGQLTLVRTLSIGPMLWWVHTLTVERS